ncbi:MAG: ATP-binding protein [Candidatus Hydrothermia bacterium]
MKILFDKLLGQEKAKKQLGPLVKLLREEKVDSLFLEFVGPDGVGKLTAAIETALAVNCTGTDLVPCRVCDNCLQISHYQHPDLFLILPDMTQEKWERVRNTQELRGFYDPLKQIKIDEIRTVEKELWRETPYNSRYRFVIIANGENLNQYSQNAFLKTLEEPFPRTVIIFIVSRPERILSTIHSRAKKIRFETLKFGDFKLYFEGVRVPVPLTLLYKISYGSIGRAKRILKTNFIEKRKKVLEGLITKNAELLQEVFKEFLTEGGNLDDFVDFYGSLVRDASYAKNGLTEFLINFDLEEDIVKFSASLREDYLEEMAQLYRRLYQLARSNIDEEVIPYIMISPIVGRSYRDTFRNY